jgi:hypothetical protein
MHGKTGDMPKHMLSAQDEDKFTSLEAMMEFGGEDEPINVLMGYNLGNPTWAADIKLSDFVDWSEIANDPEKGEVAQRRLDVGHAKNLAAFMLKGLLNAAIVKRNLQGKDIPEAFSDVQHRLGTKPYCALQPVVANIRGIDPQKPSIRAERGLTRDGNTVGFRVHMPRTYRWWIVDGQHRRFGGEMLMNWLKDVTRSGRYPARGGIVNFKGEVTPEEMIVWSEALSCTHTFATIKIEFHLGLNSDQERQLFHDLNNLGKKINVSQATEFDQGNPVNQFVREEIEQNLGISLIEIDVKDWSKDKGEMLRKDMAAINSIAFLNKTNAKSAAPEIVAERKEPVSQLWRAISNVPGFGEEGARTKTVLAQPVVLKALGKLTFDFMFSNRKPVDGHEYFNKLLTQLKACDFSHENPMWRYYQLSSEDKHRFGLSDLGQYLPDNGEVTAESNRDIGSYQGGVMRFGAKHNDIYPILADMIRWKLQLPNRHRSN